MAHAKECMFCGELFSARNDWQKLCPQCRADRKPSEPDPTPKKEIQKKESTVKTVDRYCRKCIYTAPVICPETRYKACDYIGVTGHRRPCPAGEGCTVRVTRKGGDDNG